MKALADAYAASKSHVWVYKMERYSVQYVSYVGRRQRKPGILTADLASERQVGYDTDEVMHGTTAVRVYNHALSLTENTGTTDAGQFTEVCC